jgi:hypothetical protein
MRRTNLFLKIEVEHNDDEDPRKLGREICRQIQKMYGVRHAELSAATPTDE